MIFITVGLSRTLMTLEGTVYTQPPASDYNDWAKAHNNPGWSFDDVLPLIKKVRGLSRSPCHNDNAPLLAGGVQAETYQVAPNKSMHGYTGPLKVSHGGAYTSIGEDYIVTVSQYDKSRPILEDSDANSTTLLDLNRVYVMSTTSLVNLAALGGHGMLTSRFIALAEMD